MIIRLSSIRASSQASNVSPEIHVISPSADSLPVHSKRRYTDGAGFRVFDLAEFARGEVDPHDLPTFGREVDSKLYIRDSRTGRQIILIANPEPGTWRLEATETPETIELVVEVASSSTNTSCAACHEICCTIGFALGFLINEFGPVIAVIGICLLVKAFPILISVCGTAIWLVVASPLWSEVIDLVTTLGAAAISLDDRLATLICSSLAQVGLLADCIDDLPPVAVMRFPNGGEVINGTINLSATVGADVSGIGLVEFQYSSDRGITWLPVPGPDSPDGTTVFEGTGSLRFDTISANISYAEGVLIRVRARDTVGNISLWDFTDSGFTIDNTSFLPSSIFLTTTTSPNPTDSGALVRATGSATYDDLSPVTTGTATATLDGVSRTAPLSSDGSFEFFLTAPENPTEFPIVKVILFTVSDGNVTGQITHSLLIRGLPSDPPAYDFERATTALDVEPNFPYDPIVEKSCFRSADTVAMGWAKINNVSTPVRARFGFFQPNGLVHTTVTTDFVDNGGTTMAWAKFWGPLELAGRNASNREGVWVLRVSFDAANDAEGFVHKATIPFTVRYDFTEHLMARHVDPDEPFLPSGRTNLFLSDDFRAYTWMNLGNVAEGPTVRWEWYEPNGSLYAQDDYPGENPSPNQCFDWFRAFGYIGIAGTAAATKTGRWSVGVSALDPFGEFEHLYTDEFRIDESPSVPPLVDASSPIGSAAEGEVIPIEISASDNAYLQRVAFIWDDGASHEQRWNNINSNQFSTVFYIGPYTTSRTIEFRAIGTDASGNQSISLTRFFHVLDLDSTGPVISNVLVAELAGNGDGLIEPGEDVLVSWTADDPSGVSDVSFSFDGSDIPVDGNNTVTIMGIERGTHDFLIYAQDADDTPAASVHAGIIVTLCGDSDNDGYVICTDSCILRPSEECGDCDDANVSVHAEASEICDSIDNDCDLLVDEEVTRACASGCSNGFEFCFEGSWGGCTAELCCDHIVGQGGDFEDLCPNVTTLPPSTVCVLPGTYSLDCVPARGVGLIATEGPRVTTLTTSGSYLMVDSRLQGFTTANEVLVGMDNIQVPHGPLIGNYFNQGVTLWGGPWCEMTYAVGNRVVGELQVYEGSAFIKNNVVQGGRIYLRRSVCSAVVRNSVNSGGIGIGGLGMVFGTARIHGNDIIAADNGIELGSGQLPGNGSVLEISNNKIIAGNSGIVVSTSNIQRIVRNVISNAINGIRSDFYLWDAVIAFNVLKGVVESQPGASPARGIYTISQSRWPSIVANTIYDYAEGVVLRGASDVVVSGTAVLDSNIIAFNRDTGSDVTGVTPVLILHNNVYGSSINWVGITDPIGSDGNISEDPLFRDRLEADVQLRPESPAVDSGNPGSIGIDVNGVLRLEDGDLNGIAQPDMGALELIPEVEPLVLSVLGELSWQAYPAASAGYDVYSGSISELRASNIYTQVIEQCGHQDTSIEIPEIPLPEQVLYYLVVPRGSVTGSLGFDSYGNERQITTPCQ